MDTIIAYRVNGGKLQIVTDADGEIEVFPHQDDAVEYADSNQLFKSGQADYQVIVLDEL